MPSERLAGGVEVVEHDLLHAAFAGVRRDEVVDVDGVSLADAVQATHALLEAHHGPGEVPVDHHVADCRSIPSPPASVETSTWNSPARNRS